MELTKKSVLFQYIKTKVFNKFNILYEKKKQLI